jgi:hypothetical protein
MTTQGGGRARQRTRGRMESAAATAERDGGAEIEPWRGASLGGGGFATRDSCEGERRAT